jgi:alpha-tubulin suppressor-like RCC1 family protein
VLRRGATSLSLLATLALGCERPATTLVVRVASELPWGEGQTVQSVVLTVRRGDALGTLRSERTSVLGRAEGRTALPLHVGVLETRDDPNTPVWIEALGCASPNGCTREAAVVAQRAVVGFSAGETTLLPMLLASACVAARCAVTERCEITTGTCLPATTAVTQPWRGTVADDVPAPPADRPPDVTVPDVVKTADIPAPPPDRGVDVPLPLDEGVAFDAGAPVDVPAVPVDTGIDVGSRDTGIDVGFDTGPRDTGFDVPVDRGAPAVEVGSGAAPIAVAAGQRHTCARMTDGTLRCWGANDSGQLGTGDTMGTMVPTMVREIDDAELLSARGNQTCALRPGGFVWCWGNNQRAQLGDGTYTTRLLPIRLTWDRQQAVASLAMGNEHGCAIERIGRALCWGFNQWGEVGDGTTMRRPSPTVTIGLDRPIQVSAGYQHACAVRLDRTVGCWGRNDQGQVGDGTTMTRLGAISARDLTNVAQVGTGLGFACARRSDSTVWCWGANDQGQLGRGDVAASLVPVVVAGLADAVELAVGRGHVCVRRARGTVTCWGANDQGQVGVASPGRVLRPVDVAGLADVVELALGDAHTCARRSDGTVWCWGANESGQLGDGTYLTRDIPRPVQGL